MAVIISYSNSKPYVGSKPLADIELIGPSGRFPISAVLVDTGADYLQVPASSARKIGLLPSSSAVSVPVRTVGGTLTMTMLSSVNVEIEGVSVTTDILCHPSGTSRALLGRSALKALTNVGFDPTDWMW